MTAPVIEALEAEQRDTAQTFLVDVGYTILEPDLQDVNVTLEWRRGTQGSWNPAQAQAQDRRHDDVSVPLSGLPVISPGDSFNYVWNAFFDLPEGTFTDVFVRLTIEDTAFESASEEFGPFTVSTTKPAEDDPFAKQLARRAQIAKTPLDFLGNGLVTPFRRGSRDFATSRGIDLVDSAVKQILGTRAAVGEMSGELRWRPDFGSKLWILRHRKKDPDLNDQAEAYIEEALAQEPRVRLVQAEVQPDTEVDDTRLRLKLRTEIIAENVPGNRVIVQGESELSLAV